MESTWESRDLPVLEAIVRLYEETGTLMSPSRIGVTAGVPESDVQKALRALQHNDPPYITKLSKQGNGDVYLVGAPTGHARRTVGAWPTPDALADRIIAALNEAADNEPDEVKKGKLRRAAEAVAGVGRDILTDVTAQVITKGMYGG
ncbi:hypothetical protein GCM10009745_41660 [Kribbella yunnanensis]|uniref:Uncharacterized protein n=1 Tax=Kribbella yunnanensis TaxID=190194 RepID=A0ABN2HQT4_9ACTN